VFSVEAGDARCGADADPLTTCLEILMTQPHKSPQPPPASHHPAPPVDVNKLRQQEEVKEVAGRHKNSGQKDHKGAR
jgi:hypothetical protein